MTLWDKAKQIANGAVIWGEWLGNNKHPVEYALAQSRAITCLNCPKNQPGNSVTAAVADAIKRQMELKKHLNLKVNGEKKLLTCEACGCPLRLKVWERYERIKPDADEAVRLDPSCWLLSESA